MRSPVLLIQEDKCRRVSENVEREVVILGGGYAGLMCALRLAGRTRKDPLRITLVDRRDRFLERLRLHERLANPDYVPPARLPPLREVTAEFGCVFVQGEVRAIDRAGRRVTVETPQGTRHLCYSQLVIALGSRVQTAVPGVERYAYVLETTGARGLSELKRRLRVFAGKKPHILVVGSGPMGIEAAAELSEFEGARVTIVGSGAFAAFATPSVRTHLAEALTRRGIEVREALTVTAVHIDHIATDGGDLAYDLCLWCAGFAGPRLASDAGLETEADGRIRVDPYLRALCDAAVYAAGDACLPVEWHGAPARMSAFFALTTGAHVADVIGDCYKRKRPRPFGFWTYGQAIAIGREAVGFATIPYDEQVGPVYRKRPGFHLRRFFVWLLARLIIIVGRLPWLPFWLGRGAYRRDLAHRYDSPADSALRRAP